MQNAARAPSIGEHLALSKGRSTTDPTTFNAKGKERATMDDEKDDEEMLDPQERRRRDLLHARRAELDRVYKEHDMLVRQLFHLRKFVTLIGFDPEVSGSMNAGRGRAYAVQDVAGCDARIVWVCIQASLQRRIRVCMLCVAVQTERAFQTRVND